MILHIDCNTFYASCEVAMHPEMQGKPVVVANNNETGGGIILALTKEAKAFGLKRGNPMFQVKDIIENNNITVFQANLNKYGEISRHLMEAVKEQGIVLNFRQYSIDEFFGELPLEDPQKLRYYTKKIKNHIAHTTNIPVSCGVSLSYTLAKVATWYAKHYDGYEGICVLPEKKIEIALRQMPVAEVWGIGRRTAPKLKSRNITTAFDFYNRPAHEIKHLFGINGLRTWQELHGTPSLEFDDSTQQKSISHSRTFVYMTSNLEQLTSYIVEFVSVASQKLRAQHSVCQSVTVFIATNRHREDMEQYKSLATDKMAVPTADTAVIAKTATSILKQIFKPNFQYKKAGIILSDLSGDDAIQVGLFDAEAKDIKKSRKLMSALDQLNSRFGSNAVKLAKQDS